MQAAGGVGDLWRFEGQNGVTSVRVNSRVKTNDDAVILDAMRCGIGLSIVPTFMVHEHLRTGRLRIVLDEWCREIRSIDVLHPSARRVPRKVRVFTEFVARQLEKLETSGV